MIHRIGDIDLDQDLKLQEREWKLQRISWVVLTLLVVLALLGACGTGPLSSASSGGDSEGFSVDYQRVVRHQGESRLTIHLNGDQVHEGQIEMWLGADYVNTVRVTQISPEPEEVRLADDRVIYVFSVDEPAELVTVNIDLVPQEMGWLSVDLGIVDGGDVSFSQVSLP
jgi:hypothetical protein